MATEKAIHKGKTTDVDGNANVPSLNSMDTNGTPTTKTVQESSHPVLDENRINTQFRIEGTAESLEKLNKMLNNLNSASLAELAKEADVIWKDLKTIYEGCRSVRIESFSAYSDYIELYISSSEGIPFRIIDKICETIGELESYFRTLSPLHFEPLKRQNDNRDWFLEWLYVCDTSRRLPNGSYVEKYCASEADTRDFIIERLTEQFENKGINYFTSEEMDNMPFDKLKALGIAFDIETKRYKNNDYDNAVYVHAVTGPATIDEQTTITDENGVVYSSNYAALISAPKRLKGEYHVHEGTEVIGNGALENCTKLTRVVIPNSVLIIEAGAFQGCNHLRDVVFSEGLTRIETAAFQGTALKNVAFPKTLERINHGAFEDCSKLTHIEMPKSVIFIGDWCFDGCDSLDEDSKRFLRIRFNYEFE